MRRYASVSVLASVIAALLVLAGCSDDSSKGDDAGTSGGAGSSGQGGSSGSGGAGKSGSGGSGAAGKGGAGGDSRDDDAGGGNAGTSGETDGGTSENHDGKVPVFVAMGYGTRIATSCDFGATWPYDEEAVAQGGDDGTLVRGMAYGEGWFVGALGGGGTRKILTSDDGVTWEENDLGGNGFSDVAYGEGVFVAGGGHESLLSRDASTWSMLGMMGSGGILRHLTFGNYMGGRFVAVGDGSRRMNSSNGVQWGNEICSSSCSGAGFADVAFGAGRFVAPRSSGATVYSEDGGATWKDGMINGGSNIFGIAFLHGKFYATSPEKTYTSTDGLTWTAGGNGGPAKMAVSDDGLHFAGVTSGDFYKSDDGITWHKVTTKSSQNGMNDIEFGWAKPSSTCPAQ